MAESVYGGNIQSIRADHCSPKQRLCPSNFRQFLQPLILAVRFSIRSTVCHVCFLIPWFGDAQCSYFVPRRLCSPRGHLSRVLPLGLQNSTTCLGQSPVGRCTTHGPLVQKVAVLSLVPLPEVQINQFLVIYRCLDRGGWGGVQCSSVGLLFECVVAPSKCTADVPALLLRCLGHLKRVVLVLALCPAA